MVKDDGAFLTIGELARDLGVAQHILRYWESRFPQLRPLQRSGNRRYYRPADVELARRINRLLNEEGFTVKGAQRALADRAASSDVAGGSTDSTLQSDSGVSSPATRAQGASGAATSQSKLSMEDLLEQGDKANGRKAGEVVTGDLDALIARLTSIRENLEQALSPQ